MRVVMVVLVAVLAVGCSSGGAADQAEVEPTTTETTIDPVVAATGKQVVVVVDALGEWDRQNDYGTPRGSRLAQDVAVDECGKLSDMVDTLPGDTYNAKTIGIECLSLSFGQLANDIGQSTDNGPAHDSASLIESSWDAYLAAN